jgi:hypothetical protein
MSEHGIRFEPTDPPDPDDLRVVPADMQFTPLVQNGRAYIGWKISETIRLNKSSSSRQHPYALEMLISPRDARDYAQMLLDVADMAEDLQRGGPGRPKGVESATE